MLPSPSSSPRAILEDRLNFDVAPPKKRKTFLLTPPKESPISRKRLAKQSTQGNSRKRAKVCEPADGNIENETEEEDSNLFEESDDEEVKLEPTMLWSRTRRTVFNAYSMLASASPHTYKNLDVSTRPILQSFVSSLKTDAYTCQSLNTTSFLTPPYACSYSNAAKSGGRPLLAVATEEGTVQIITTSKRKPWEPELTRTILQPHTNGVFDVKWDRSDSQIVTCSGDHSSRITSVERNVITHGLHGHDSTVKTAAWDPTNDSLLATGGRDGTICLWDLRNSSTKSADGVSILSPVIVIADAHEDPTKPKARKSKKHTPMPKTVTSLIYPEGEPYGLVSSGAFDGILRFWDLRKLETPRKSRLTKPKPPSALFSSPTDPTTLNGSKRSRGIISLVQGSGPTAGLVFGMGQDSRIHTYALSTLTPQPMGFAEDAMHASSFYVGLSLSPCGNWLACGASSPKSSTFLFEVTGAGRSGGHVEVHPAVELQGQKGEIGAVDWADGCLATCADDGMVRVWRPDVEVYQQCQEDPDEAQWEWYWSKQVR
ncbi:WD40 repeat-like protein [Macrolepiota fuliginosa MF-IS2]|uniref:WD40 repeat-like protein n=1 Tax=Macrolepiota fuliginosa MF-IS2 TaxID=1400762 RepID=A0A9P5XMD4_9AGAR|nr:WD40 repeat-like protein [Macrolepiota fuliginosa MF-IS2]